MFFRSFFYTYQLYPSSKSARYQPETNSAQIFTIQFFSFQLTLIKCRHCSVGTRPYLGSKPPPVYEKKGKPDHNLDERLDMRTIVCNSAQSFLDMAENDLLKGMNVHCVFPASESVRRMILHCQKRHNIRNVSFSKITAEPTIN